MDKGFYHTERGYWQTVGGNPSVTDYPEGTIEVPLKPGENHHWQGGAWIYTPPPEPTSEELREQMPELTPRQFRDALIDADIMPDQVTAAIAQIPDEKQRAKALNAWEYPTQFSRTDPLIDQIGAMFSLSPEQIDTMWNNATDI